MKTSILICTIIISLFFVSCGQNMDTREFKYEIATSSGSAMTEAEKSQAFEKQLIQRLQDAIKAYFDNVIGVIINIDSSSETEKIVDVLITTESNEPLTDEEKTGITNFIKNSISSDLTVTINLKEEQQAD